MTLHDLAAGYAVSALDADDLAAFERHLATCGACQQEVSSLRGAAAVLGASGALSGIGAAGRAPESLRSAVLTAVRTAPQAAPQAIPGATEAQEGPHPTARPRRRFPLAWLGLAAAASVAAILGVGVGLSLGAGDEGDSLAAHEHAMRIMSATDAHTMNLPLGRSSLVMSESQDAAVLMGDAIPRPSDGREYQVWMGHADGTAGAGPTFMPDGDGAYMVILEGDMTGVTEVFVTVEPHGGSPSPTSAAVASITLGA